LLDSSAELPLYSGHAHMPYPGGNWNCFSCFFWGCCDSFCWLLHWAG